MLITHKLCISCRLSFLLYTFFFHPQRHFVDNVTGFYFIFIGILHGFSGSSSSSRRRRLPAPHPVVFSFLLSSTKTHTQIYKQTARQKKRKRLRQGEQKRNENNNHTKQQKAFELENMSSSFSVSSGRAYKTVLLLSVHCWKTHQCYLFIPQSN